MPIAVNVMKTLVFFALTGLACAVDQITNGQGRVVDVNRDRLYQNLIGTDGLPDPQNVDPETANRARIAKNLRGDSTSHYSNQLECDDAYGRLMLEHCDGTCDNNGQVHNHIPCSSGDYYEMLQKCYCVPLYETRQGNPDDASYVAVS